MDNLEALIVDAIRVTINTRPQNGKQAFVVSNAQGLSANNDDFRNMKKDIKPTHCVALPVHFWSSFSNIAGASCVKSAMVSLYAASTASAKRGSAILPRSIKHVH
jgi:hypothetical protein